MKIEIHTTTGTWILQRERARDGDVDPGARAAEVRAAIENGQPLEVRRAEDESFRPAGRIADVRRTIFNPAHVICVAEEAPRRRGVGLGLGGP